MAKDTAQLAASLGLSRATANEPDRTKVIGRGPEPVEASAEEKPVTMSSRRHAHPQANPNGDIFSDTRGNKGVAAKDERVIFTLSAETKSRWKAKADDAGVSLSEFIRRIVNDYCISH